MKVNSLYVAAKDFERAKICYAETIFQKSPDIETDRFVFFDLNGFLFGIFNPTITGEEITYGNNAVPTIEVDDVDAQYKRLTDAGLKSIMPPQDVNGTRIAQIEDTEGNTLEFYQWNK
ncbi:MAG: hypothetical protein F6K24_03745 [Okeania sp. SIO2D1]|nr:hypothetical protein [Okeania sp. SIO2D1]